MSEKHHIGKYTTKDVWGTGVYKTFCGIETISFTGMPDCSLESCPCMDKVNCEECMLLYFQHQAEQNVGELANE